jgi:adenosylcobinamide-GDP ribazoletransferase
MRVERDSGAARLLWPALPIRPALRGARAAFVSFSRLPLGGYPYRAAEWRWAPAHLPLVGATLGALAAGVWLLAGAAGLSPALGSTLAVATALLASGALHEDGLADAADGLGAAAGDRERVLAIMKDSRIGSYGALAIGLSLLLRVSAVASLGQHEWFALLHVHCLARLGPVRLMLSERYVSDAGSAKSPVFLPIGHAQLALALSWALLCSLLGGLAGWLSWQAAACMLAVLTLLSALAARYFRSAVGGITGDLLGALEQVSEIALLITYLVCR